MTVARHFSPLAGRLSRRAVIGALLLYCLIGVALIAIQLGRIPLLTDAGYGDSYIFYDVLHLQRTGTIYRDLSQPPYLAAQYSPAVYLLFALPGHLFTFANPFIGPRLLAFGSLVACLLVVGSLARALVLARHSATMSILLACTIGFVAEWSIQLRSDFPGIFFGLLAIRLLLARPRWALPLAGLCAGFALQFKITFIAAGLTGTIWLASRRQWKELGIFIGAAALSSIGLYALYWLREPAMLAQMLALSPGVPDARGAARLAIAAATNFVAILALAGLPLLLPKLDRRWSLLVLYVVVAFAVAAATAIQAGSNANYFFEALFGAIPLAVLGASQLGAIAEQHPELGMFLVALLAVYLLVPQVDALRTRLVVEQPVGVQNEHFQELSQVLGGHRVLSTVPRIALLDSSPALVEPFLLSYFERMGRRYPEPLLARVRAGEFDVAVTEPVAATWRKIPHIDPRLHAAIAASYRPACTFGGWLIHLPRSPHPDDASITSALAQLRCVPYDTSRTPGW